jgi:flagella basal body P-ring formation protein FlgA
MIVAMPNCSTNRLLPVLACLLVLPCPAAQPATSPSGDFTTLGACGDLVRSLILKQRILGAIQEEVSRRTSPDTVTIEEQDLQIQACPRQVDTEFVIKRAEYDAARDVTVFYLASAQQGNIPPLIVTVNKQRSVRVMVAKRDVHSGQIASMNDFVEATRSSGNLLLNAAGLSAAVPNPVRTDPVTRPALKTKPNSALLVKVGMPSELVLRGKNFTGGMTVIPLDSGRLGDEVRVRDPATQNILRATVTNINRLEEIF